MVGISAFLSGCATAPTNPSEGTVSMPLLTGWFQGQAVYYVTTDVSDVEVARAKNSNYAPRLVNALPTPEIGPGHRSSVDIVYGVTNFSQGSIFASAPEPVGAGNQDPSYSPLWQLAKVTWRTGRAPHVLKSEEDILDAAEHGVVDVSMTRVVLNCPIVHRGPLGGLPGVAINLKVRSPNPAP